MAIGGGAGIGGGVSDWGLVGMDWARGVAIRLNVFRGQDFDGLYRLVFRIIDSDPTT